MPRQFDESTYIKIEKSAQLFSDIKYEVHTQRINLAPLNSIDDCFIAELAEFCKNSGVRWFNYNFPNQ